MVLLQTGAKQMKKRLTSHADIIKLRPWVSEVQWDDLESAVDICLLDGWYFKDDEQCGTTFCDTWKEAEIKTRGGNVYN